MKFQCKRCGSCCRWPGAVKVSSQEVDAIAAFLNIDAENFLEEHTRLTSDRQHLSLCENSRGECEFLVENQCLIEPVKPQQCRNFPEKWNFPGWQKLCAGGENYD